MALKTMIADLTDIAVSVDGGTPSECQPTYVEGPALEDASSWSQRCERLLRRLEHGMGGSALAARSASCVAHGLQRTRAISDEFENPCFLDCEGGGGEEALMAASTRRARGATRESKEQWTVNKNERLSSADKGEA